MADSMTGFGRSMGDASAGKLIVEIQSVNRRHLEVSVSLPKEYARFEQEVRKWVSERLGRGQVSVRIHLIPNQGAIEAFLPDAGLLSELKKGWERLARGLGYQTSEITLSFLVQQASLPAIPLFADEKDLAQLHQLVEEALQGLVQMRKIEGNALTQELGKQLELLESQVAEVRNLAPESLQKMREKLQARLLEALQPGIEMDERIIKEIALFAEKVDITEELIRLSSHFSQFRETLKAQEKGVGRKMDFLIQEMGREINTVGSKSAEVRIPRLVIEMKSICEKMREQVQNIE